MGFSFNQPNPMMQQLMNQFQQVGGGMQGGPLQGGGGGGAAMANAYAQPQQYQAEPYQMQGYQPQAIESDPYASDNFQKMMLASLFQQQPLPANASGAGLVGGTLANLGSRIADLIQLQQMGTHMGARAQEEAAIKAQADALRRQLMESQIAKNNAQAAKAGKGGKGGSKGSGTFSIPNAGPPPA